jgi:hypothetical protein
MLTRKKAIELTRQSENLVFCEIEDIAHLIQIHAELGMDEMEVFVEKAAIPKIRKVLDKKKFYSRVFEFESLQNESRLYISWISNLL